MSSRAGGSSKIKVLGSLEWHKNQAQIALDCGRVLGSRISKKRCNFCEKLAPKGNPNWSPSWTWAGENSIISPMGHQGCPSDAQRCPKVPKFSPRVAKGCQNKTKMLPKLAKCGTKAIPKGGLSSKYIYICIYTCSDKGDRKASQRAIAHDRKDT